MKIKKFNIIAKNVIETEITSLRKLKQNINISFEKAVKTILNCKNGKIIIKPTKHLKKATTNGSRSSERNLTHVTNPAADKFPIVVKINTWITVVA